MTLQANAQREGTGVVDFLEHHSHRVLAKHGFNGDGQPTEAVLGEVTAGTDRRQKAEVVEEQLAAVAEEMAQRGFSPEQIDSVRQRAAGAVHEDPAHCTTVSVDDVDVKKQKAHRERAAAKPGDSPAIVPEPTPTDAARKAGKSSRPRVANTVARIEQGSKRFTLSAGSLGQVLRCVLAFLLHNELLGG
jgi:hypothetical protein